MQQYHEDYINHTLVSHHVFDKKRLLLFMTLLCDEDWQGQFRVVTTLRITRQDTLIPGFA